MSIEILAILAGIALAEPAPAREPAKSKQSQIECRTEVQTATRVGRKRICTTKKIWDQIRDEHLESNAHRKVDAERSRPCTSIPCR